MNSLLLYLWIPNVIPLAWLQLEEFLPLPLVTEWRRFVLTSVRFGSGGADL